MQVGIRLLKTMVLSRDLSTAAVVDLDAGQPIPETHPEVNRDISIHVCIER